MRYRPEIRERLEDSPRDRVTTETAQCAAGYTAAEPGRRGERPPLSWSALTDACARRRPPVTGGRSPRRPGRVFPRTRREHCRWRDRARPAITLLIVGLASGSVKARRQAPPARCAAGGLDGALGAARSGSYVMARRCHAHAHSSTDSGQVLAASHDRSRSKSHALTTHEEANPLCPRPSLAKFHVFDQPQSKCCPDGCEFHSRTNDVPQR